MINYSKAIKKLKKNLSLSDKQLGEMLGVSSNSVYLWMIGRTSPRGGNKSKVDQELLKNNIVSQEDLAEPGSDATPPVRNKRTEKRGRRSSGMSTVAKVASADRNLLKTYYTQLAAEKKIKSFHLEIQGINKKHVRDLKPEQWAEIMTLLEDF